MQTVSSWILLQVWSQSLSLVASYYCEPVHLKPTVTQINHDQNWSNILTMYSTETNKRSEYILLQRRVQIRLVFCWLLLSRWIWPVHPDRSSTHLSYASRQLVLWSGDTLCRTMSSRQILSWRDNRSSALSRTYAKCWHWSENGERMSALHWWLLVLGRFVIMFIYT